MVATKVALGFQKGWVHDGKSAGRMHSQGLEHGLFPSALLAHSSEISKRIGRSHLPLIMLPSAAPARNVGIARIIASSCFATGCASMVLCMCAAFPTWLQAAIVHRLCTQLLHLNTKSAPTSNCMGGLLCCLGSQELCLHSAPAFSNDRGQRLFIVQILKLSDSRRKCDACVSMFRLIGYRFGFVGRCSTAAV